MDGGEFIFSHVLRDEVQRTVQELKLRVVLLRRMQQHRLGAKADDLAGFGVDISGVAHPGRIDDHLVERIFKLEVVKLDAGGVQVQLIENGLESLGSVDDYIVILQIYLIFFLKLCSILCS